MQSGRDHQEVESKMKKVVDHLHQELKTLRTGRASLAILDGVRVDYFGTPTPLNQVANLQRARRHADRGAALGSLARSPRSSGRSGRPTSG